MVALYGAVAAAAITVFQITFFTDTYPALSEVGAERVAQIIGLFLGWCIPLSLCGFLAARTIAKSLVVYERHMRETSKRPPESNR